MKYLLFLMPLIAGCQFVPEIAKGIEEIETDTAICVAVSKETFQRETDLEIYINVKNKEEKEK